MVRFLDKPDLFVSYKEPSHSTKLLGLADNVDAQDREEVIKRLALAHFINSHEFTQLAVDRPQFM